LLKEKKLNLNFKKGKQNGGKFNVFFIIFIGFNIPRFNSKTNRGKNVQTLPESKIPLGIW